MGTKPFVIYTKRLATILCDLGFKLVDSRRQDENPKFYIYFFEDSPELRAAVEKYKGGGSNG